MRILLLTIILLSLKLVAAQETKPSHTEFLKINPFIIATGNASVYYERFVSDRIAYEVSLGYIFYEIYDKNSDNLEFTSSPSKGISFSSGLKYNLDPYYKKNRTYLEPLFLYKHSIKTDIEKIYWQAADVESSHYGNAAVYFPYEENVCDECVVNQTERTNVLAFQLLIGNQAFSEKERMIDVYFGLGYRFKFYNIDILKIRETQNYQPPQTYYFDNFNVRLKRQHATVHLGIRVGIGVSSKKQGS